MTVCENISGNSPPPHPPPLIRRMPLVEQELGTLPKQPSSPPVFSRVQIAQSLAFCVMYCRSLFVPFPLSLYSVAFLDLRLLIAFFLYLQMFPMDVICK